MTTKIRTSGLLICVGGDKNERDLKGNLVPPPLLAAVYYDEENDCLRLEAVSWKLAKALAPDDVKCILAQLVESRREWGTSTPVNGISCEVAR